ncbi:hypothetical protein BU204_01480 [Actinophytocola xanthii]|uniref:DUF305 domain-containing protein n=1 Tax=Actinophytocola xanthii TaxID=1912961 RepID=A0A1Q8CZ98_9PSEU|nr:hypothetical protein BU204_01480 [Actinophytocola xanthii]
MLATVGVVVAAGGLVACTQEEPNTPTNSAPVIVPGRPGEEASTIAPGEATPLEQDPPNEADVTFVQDMIVHHAQAVEMAELAPTRASAKDVKGLADRIADSQRPEMDMLNRWLEQHDKPTVNPEAPDHGGGHGGHADHTSMPGFAGPEQMAALQAASGARFDTLFLQMMTTHHEGALTMIDEVRSGGLDVRVQEIADDIAVTQIDEIHRMRGMLGA